MSWTHIKDEIRKARKAYRCRVCNEVISIGEAHIARTGVDDGFITFRFHAECEELSSYWDTGDWETIEPGDIKRPNKQEAI